MNAVIECSFIHLLLMTKISDGKLFQAISRNSNPKLKYAKIAEPKKLNWRNKLWYQNWTQTAEVSIMGNDVQ